MYRSVKLFIHGNKAMETCCKLFSLLKASKSHKQKSESEVIHMILYYLGEQTFKWIKLLY